MGTNVTQYNGTLPAAPDYARERLERDKSIVQRFVDGISMPFPVLSIRGKDFTLKWNGETVDLPKPMEVVLVNSSGANAKSYYIKGFTEDSADAPDCWSNDGVTPDASVAQPQAPACPGCQHNKFGTAPSRDGIGGKGKACSDSRRLALMAPYQITDDDTNMGPFSLRVPVTSHATLRAYIEFLAKHGYPPNCVVTLIDFERGIAYPKLTFTFHRMLSREEYVTVQEVEKGDKVKRILMSPPEGEEISSANLAAPVQHASFGLGAAKAQAAPPADVQVNKAQQPAPDQLAALAKAQAQQDARNASIKAGVLKAAQTVQEKQAPVQVDGDEIITLADGRHYSTKQRKFVDLPKAAPPPEPDEIVPAAGGRMFNVTKGVYVDDAPEVAEQTPPPEDQTTPTWVPPNEAPQFNPNAEAKPEANQAEKAPPKKRAAKEEKAAPAQPASRGLNDIISKMAKQGGATTPPAAE